MLKMELEKTLKLYDYKLPPKLIAQQPTLPQDKARLLVFNKINTKLGFSDFIHLPKYLPKNSVLVFNQTKVIPARIVVQKSSGGLARILYISQNNKLIKALSDRKLTVGEWVGIYRHPEKKFKVTKHWQNYYFLKPSFPLSNLRKVLDNYGQTPLPPYIKNSKLTEKQKRTQYQAVFAKQGKSIAAPTASLHFTKRLIKKLKVAGIKIEFVQLDVNLGTFAPLKQQNLQNGKLHSENYNIDTGTAKKLNYYKKSGKKIIAVGTTVARTLESASTNSGQIKKLRGNTALFIYPGYNFKFIDGLITNFHVPKSSLLMLVAALTGRKKLFYIYQRAIQKNFRFFSFGDGMLIL